MVLHYGEDTSITDVELNSVFLRVLLQESVAVNHVPIRTYMISVPNLSFLERSRDFLTPTLMLMYKVAPECIGARFSIQCGAQLPYTQLIPMLQQGIIEFCFNIFG